MNYLIINYDLKSTRHYHITHIFDKLVENNSQKYSYISLDELIGNSNSCEKMEKFFIDKFKNIPKYIISFSGIGHFYTSYKIICNLTKLVFIIDDIHHGKSIRNYRIPVINSSHMIFSTYAYQFDKWGLPKHSNLFFFPHSARWICEFNQNPIMKILISGRISDIYEDRIYVYNIAKKKPDNFDILNCNFSYRIDVSNDDNICGKKFYDYLNKYLCCFVDTTRDYILAKVFEICASGALLLCMNTNVKNIMDDIGFKDKFNYISCTRENFNDVANYILDKNNLNEINKIRYEGYKLIINNHTWEHRMNYFKKILESQNN